MRKKDSENPSQQPTDPSVGDCNSASEFDFDRCWQGSVGVMFGMSEPTLMPAK